MVVDAGWFVPSPLAPVTVMRVRPEVARALQHSQRSDIKVWRTQRQSRARKKVISEVISRRPAAHRSLSVVSGGGREPDSNTLRSLNRGRARLILARFRILQ